MKVLSVVIPSYNTESFIEKDVNTFIDEKLFDDVEILIINDGSKDKTGEIADRFEAQYPGFIRHINKENGGHGSVINRGIQEAQGKYFKVVDGDDWVNTENLIRLVEELKTSDADIVLNQYIKVDQTTGNERLCEAAPSEFYGRGTVEFADLQKTATRYTIQSVTYKTSILRDNHIHMTEKCFYEDFQYTLYPVPYIKTALCLDFPVYYYLVGQKTQSVSAESSLRNMPMYIRVYRDSVEYFNHIASDVLTKKYMEEWILIFYRSMYNIFLRNYKADGIMTKMLEADAETRTYSEIFYISEGKKHKYINILRKGNVLVFRIIGAIFTRYKSRDIN